MPVSDSARYSLGPLCKREHEYEKTGQSLRYRGSCVKCQRLISAKYKSGLAPEIRRQRDREYYARSSQEGRPSHQNKIERDKKWKKANPEKRRDTQRRYAASHPGSHSEFQKENRNRYRAQSRARGVINAAIARGDMPAANSVSCVDCGDTWKPGDVRHEYDHYNGYEGEAAKQVQAVCKPCHTARGVLRRSMALEDAAKLPFNVRRLDHAA